MTKTPINEAIARIIGEAPEIHIYCGGTEKPKEFYCQCVTEKAAEVLLGRDKKLSMELVYPDYLHDANAALRALAWARCCPICIHLTCGYDETGVLLWWMETYMNDTRSHNPCETICKIIVMGAKGVLPDLLDYDNIDWGDDA